MRTLYLDCFCGISGDMTVGALLDAGADFKAIETGLKSLGVDGYHLHRRRLNKHGIMATQFEVHVGEHDHAHKHEPTHDHGHDHGHAHSHGHHHDHGHAHAHEHHHDHSHDHGQAHAHEHHHDHGHGHAHSHAHGHAPHRHLHHIVGMIRGSALPEAVKQSSIATFEILAEAEAAVHGTTVDKIHFHEVGAIDSIVDIVGAQYAMHLLGVERVECSPLPLGGGTVKCDHGIMPVPAPATAMLLRGIPAHGGPVPFELVTPTGAALVKQRAAAFGPQPAMRVEAIGYGSGTRDLDDRPNVLRVALGEAVAAIPTEMITVLEANIDDMNGELFPPLLEALLGAGARDAFLTPVLGKKGRPAQRVTVLCDAEKSDVLARVIFENGTSFGVRMREEKRIVLDRAFKHVRTPWGVVHVKVGALGGEAMQAAPEFEDCAKAAKAAGVPVRKVYEAALAAALRGEFDDA